MRIKNTTYRLELRTGGKWLDKVTAPFGAALGTNTHPLRFSIVDVTAREIVIEATVVEFDANSDYADCLSRIEILQPRKKPFQAEAFGVVQIIPTGIRCEFGGFACGDACPVTNLLASTADFLVTHPNAVNASELNEMAGNVLYVEGRSLDDFLLGYLGLLRVRANRIGTFIDKAGIAYLDDVVNTLNAARAAAGISCELYTVLSEEPGVEIEWFESGCAGNIRNPVAILRSGRAVDVEGNRRRRRGVGDPRRRQGVVLGICEAKSRIRPGALRRSLPI